MQVPNMWLRCRLMEVHHYISTRLPYWNRNGGRDHIIVRRILMRCLLALVCVC